MANKQKQLICMLMAMLMFIGTVIPAAAQGEVKTLEQNAVLTIDDLQALNNGTAEIFSHNDRVTFVDGKCTDEPVKSMDDAAQVVLSMLGLLGGDERVQFEPWRTLTDTAGNTYYVFRQMYAGSTVLNGAVKVITDSDGNMTALSSSIETELPEVETSDGITAEEAENLVLKYAEENSMPDLTLMPEFTDKIILPVVLSVNDDGEDSESRFVWVVYSNNPKTHPNQSTELPYLAHYVDMSGNYLYSLATILPGDTAGATGFDTDYVFGFMEPAEYTGYVDLSDGTEKEITVTLMKDKRTGMYYLGNIDRKIVAADCWEFLYNNGNVRLVASPDNLEWDQVALLSFYNYCRAYDYYKEIGWIGGNGLDTPIMILNNFCDENHIQVDNAAFMGNYLGWSLFAASLANDYSQCLDVIAHEFTHCVTGSVMTYNSYMNDYGAINEGMSDVQGEICEQMLDDIAEDDRWILGNNSLTPIRSMSDPHRFGQPEFSWDLYYKPKVQTPTGINDYGGVHTNSSLLNNVAYRLIADGGMSLEEARAFWFAVDCSMVPGTDYAQLSELLPWVMKAQGMDQYQTALQKAIDATRLGISEMPDFFDNDRALVKLVLPDNENFTDSNWAMQIFSVDVHGFFDKVVQIYNQVISGDYSALPQTLQELMTGEMEEEEEPEPTPEPEDKGFWNSLFEVLSNPESFITIPEPTPEPETESELTPEQEKELSDWLREEFLVYFYSNMSSAGQDGQTVYMMSRPGRTIPLLLHMSFKDESGIPDQVVFAIFINNRWYNLPGVAELFTEGANPEAESGEEPQSNPEMDKLMEDLANRLFSNLDKIKSVDDFLDLFTLTIKGGDVCEIPTTGLEEIVLPEPSDTIPEFFTQMENVPGRMSRPKLPEE